MATVYVSKAATNGYAIGNDSNTYAQMQSKSTPALTVKGCLTKVQAGDTIVINDGLYNETGGSVQISVANLTINAENDYMTTIRCATGDTRVILQNDTGTGLTLGRLVIDANYAQQNCVQQLTSANVGDLTLNGTRLTNFTLYGISSQTASNITLQDGYSIISDSNVYTLLIGVYLTAITVAGTITVKDGTIEIDGGANATDSARGIYLTGAVDGCNLVVENNDITLASAAPEADIIGIYAPGFITVEINDNTITETSLQNSSGSYNGIVVPNAAITTKKCWIYNNTLNGGNPNPATNASGANIIVGDDANTEPTYHNSINGVWIYDNIGNNMNHQLLLGWITKGIVIGNKFTNGVLGVIGKHTTGCLFSGNILVGIRSGGALRAKYGGTGDIYCNNTIIMTSVSTTAGIAINATDGSAGVVFKNNIVYMDGIAAICAKIEDTSTATFATNDYYSDLGFAANPFVYQASNYANLAAWIAAQESTALNVDPDFVDYDNGDYRVPAANADLYHKGTYAVAEARDYRLRPFNVKPTVGAYEVTSGDTCGTRTVRAA